MDGIARLLRLKSLIIAVLLHYCVKAYLLDYLYEFND